MLSLIICSRNQDISVELKQNISTTVGHSHEIIVIDNSTSQYDIFQAYNEGVRRSTGDILCFMHEDVLFHSPNWGATIHTHFLEDKQIGIIGFAGTHFLPDSPMYWYSSPFISQRNLNNDHGQREEHFHEAWFGNHNLIEVVAVDGFCFLVKRELFHHIAFDEKTYSGFHLYDMDICMQTIASGQKVCVCNDILTEHFWSEKSQTSKQGWETFQKNLKLFSDKWQSWLPIHKGIDLPTEVFERTNALYQQVYDTMQIKKSKAYRIVKKIKYF